MLLLGLDTLEELEERDRLEKEGRLCLASGASADPENSEGPPLSKRPRHEAVAPAAPQAAESAGEPVAGAKSPRSPEMVDSARLSQYALDPAVLENFPLFSFGDDPVSVGDGLL